MGCFDGSWELTEDFALALGFGIPLHELAPKENVSTKVWATALAVAFLKVVLPSMADEWEFVASKAQAWLSQEPSIAGGSDLIMAKALEALKALEVEAAKRSEAAKHVEEEEAQNASANGITSSPDPIAKASPATNTNASVPGMINYEDFVRMMMSK